MKIIFYISINLASLKNTKQTLVFPTWLMRLCIDLIMECLQVWPLSISHITPSPSEYWHCHIQSTPAPTTTLISLSSSERQKVTDSPKSRKQKKHIHQTLSIYRKLLSAKWHEMLYLGVLWYDLCLFWIWPHIWELYVSNDNIVNIP